MGSDTHKSASDVIRDSFQKLAGLPCWNVRQGYGSFLTFEFGEPELVFRRAITKPSSENLGRDRVHVHGMHHLWIEQCEWEFTRGAAQLAYSESSKDEIATAASKLAGQRLVHLSMDGEEYTSIFKFEQGHFLKVYPYEDVPENLPIWHLYSPNMVLSYLDTGTLEYGPGDAPSGTLAICGDVDLTIVAT